MPPVSNEIDGAYYFAFIVNNIEISYICTVVTVMGKQCWSQAVLVRQLGA